MKHRTVRVQKLVTGFIAAAFMVVFLGGCQKIENFVVDSRVNYTITVPKSTDENIARIWFQAPFYRVFLGDEPYGETVKESYIVGTEAVLKGEHVEQLEGAQVIMHIMDMKEDVDEHYYQSIAWQRCRDSDKIMDSAETEKVKKELSDVVEQAKIITANIVFDGCIMEDVRIDQLEIPMIGFSYSFDHFWITTCEFEEDAVIDTGEIVDYMQAGGIFVGETISESGYLPVEGVVQTDLQSIELYSLNDVCTIIEEENNGEFGESGSSVNGPRQLKDYRKGDTLAITIPYVFDGIENIEAYDAAITSLLVKYITVDGKKVWSLYYQPAITDGKYLLASYYDEM